MKDKDKTEYRDGDPLSSTEPVGTIWASDEEKHKRLNELADYGMKWLLIASLGPHSHGRSVVSLTPAGSVELVEMLSKFFGVFDEVPSPAQITMLQIQMSTEAQPVLEMLIFYAEDIRAFAFDTTEEELNWPPRCEELLQNYRSEIDPTMTKERVVFEMMPGTSIQLLLDYQLQ